MSFGEWEEVALGDVCDFQNGFAFKSKTFRESGEPVLRISNIQQGTIETKNIVFIERSDYDKDLSQYEVYPGDLLIAMSGGTTGKIGINDTQTTFLLNQRVGKFIPRPNLDKQFLTYFLETKVEESLRISAGAAQPNLSTEQIKSFSIPFPEVAEQKRIVSILDEAFSAIAKAKENAEKNLLSARELFESYLNRVFTQQGPGWQEKTLPDISENLDRQRKPITKSKREPGKIPYYGASGVVDHVKDFLFDEDLLLISEDGANLLARTYPIAFSASGKTWVNNHAHVLRFDDFTTQRFIEFYLNSISLEPWVSGMAQPKLNQTKLNTIPVPTAPPGEQVRVVELLEVLQAEAKRLETIYTQKLANLDELKQSLLQKAFTGQLTAQELAEV